MTRRLFLGLITLVSSLIVDDATAQIPLPSSIDDSTFGPLLSGSVYIANQNVTVPSGKILTVQPDVVVKFAPGRVLIVAGTMNVVALPGTPSFFTSIRDDSVGGITDPADPAPGDWNGISFGVLSDASALKSTRVRFAGGGGTAAIVLNAADIGMDDVAVERSASNGVNAGVSRPVITDSRFTDNVGRAVDLVALPALANFQNNTATGNGLDAVRITSGGTAGSQTIAPQNVINDTLVIGPGGANVGLGHTLTVEAGVIFKWESSVLVVSGVLLTNGSPADPVVFTSLADDAVGGDIANDGPTAGAPGDWNGISFGSLSDASALRSTSVRFAGGGGTAAIVLNSADIELDDVAVERSGSNGLNPGVSRPVVTDCRFDQNLGRAVDSLSWTALAGFSDNTAAGNGLGELTRIGAGTISGSVRIDPWNALNGDGVIVVDNLTVVGTNQALILGAGLILKFSVPGASGFFVDAGVLFFDGRGYAPIVLTTIEDDEFGGDTNDDGSSTAPMPGAWSRVRYSPNAAPAQMNHVRVRFGGRNVPAAVTCDSPNVSLDAVRVDLSSNDGFNIGQNGGGMRNLVAFANFGDGIVCQKTAVSVIHATSAANQGRGVVSEGSHTGSLSASIAWFNGVNANDNVVGFGSQSDVVQRVFFTDGSAGHVGVNGNFVADPLFVDPSQSDLTLSLFSPCVGTAGFPNDAFTYEDHDGNSRVLDHNLFGFALPDIGAYEYHVYDMRITGAARIGTSITLRVEGQPFQGNPPGTALLLLGTPFQGIGVFLPPFGNANIFTPGGLFVPLFTFPTSTSIVLPIPDDPNLVGLGFGLQALVRPLGNPAVGNLANPFHAVISN